jgi:hypothetical protein
LLNLKNNRHSDFFRNLPSAVHIKAAFKEIQEYANSNTKEPTAEIPPDLTIYNRIYQNRDENENIGTMSTQELAEAVEAEGGDPLDYKYYDSIQTPKEILTSIERIESIIADEETMRFLVIHSVNKLWKRIIAEYDNEDPNRIANIIEGIKRNGNHYHDEVVEQFLTEYNGSVNIRNNLPKGYSFPYKPKIM